MNRFCARQLCLSAYDAIGFDLDHTLAKYNLINQLQLTYDSIIDYLVKVKGYPETMRSDLHTHKDFIAKGLFIDTERGNIIKISHSGKILRASHGTHMLPQDKLTSIYGDKLIWEHFNEARDTVRARCGEGKFAFWDNFFDVPGIIVCAQLIDYHDKQNNGPLDSYKSIIWESVPAALSHNYWFEYFGANKGYFFPGIKSRPEKYYRPCSDRLKQWLKDLKKLNKCVFLTTSSHIDFASLTASSVLGPDWKSYFDIIMSNARKPGFFRDNKPFLSLDGIKECDSVPYTDLKQHGVYSSGNHIDLEKFVTKLTGAETPKIVYFGDSLCSDAYPVKTMTNWDMVLVLEEMEAEGYHPEHEIQEKSYAEEESFVLSEIWGSFFYHPEEDPLHNRHMNTFWGELITKYCDIAIPSVEYIANLPLDHKFPCFVHEEDGNTDGFSPAKPKPLLNN
ncbi:5'-nucleotidase domain-containing protein 1 [Mactra antiquata]